MNPFPSPKLSNGKFHRSSAFIAPPPASELDRAGLSHRSKSQDIIELPNSPQSPLFASSSKQPSSPLSRFSITSLEGFHLSSTLPDPPVSPRSPLVRSYSTPSPSLLPSTSPLGSPMQREGSLHGMNVADSIWSQPIRGRITPPLRRIPDLRSQKLSRRRSSSPSNLLSRYSLVPRSDPLPLHPSPTIDIFASTSKRHSPLADGLGLGLKGLKFDGRRLDYAGGRGIVLSEVPRCKPYGGKTTLTVIDQI